MYKCSFRVLSIVRIYVCIYSDLKKSRTLHTHIQESRWRDSLPSDVVKTSFLDICLRVNKNKPSRPYHINSPTLISRTQKLVSTTHLNEVTRSSGCHLLGSSRQSYTILHTCTLFISTFDTFV